MGRTVHDLTGVVHVILLHRAPLGGPGQGGAADTGRHGNPNVLPEGKLDSPMVVMSEEAPQPQPWMPRRPTAQRNFLFGHW